MISIVIDFSNLAGIGYSRLSLSSCIFLVIFLHKFLFSGQMVLPIAVEDVKREVKILQALTGHENVVHFHNAFEDDSYVYIAME